MIVDVKALGQAIKLKREAEGKSLMQASLEMDISASMIRYYEKGFVGDVGIKKLTRISEWLGVDFRKFIREEELA